MVAYSVASRDLKLTSSQGFSPKEVEVSGLRRGPKHQELQIAEMAMSVEFLFSKETTFDWDAIAKQVFA